MSVVETLHQRVPTRLEPLVSGGTFGRFLSVGIAGAVVDTAVLTLAVIVGGVPNLWAKLAGIEAAVVVMFLLNERWTFSEQGKAGIAAFVRRLGKSHLVRSGGVALQLATFWLLIGLPGIQLTVGGVDLWFIVASILSIGIAMLLNYVFEGLFTWDIHDEASTGDESMGTAD